VTAFVLVHGGFHGAWCWESVIKPLRAEGHHVQAVDLPGRGATADRVATVTFEDWVAAVSAAIDSAPETPVLVGHSVGGVTVSQVAECRGTDIVALVYVAGVVPVDGATGYATLLEPGPSSALLTEGAFVASADGTTGMVPPEHALVAFYGRTEPATAQTAIARLCPEAMRPLQVPVSLGTSYARVPKTYIGATHDRAVPLAFQRQLADRCGATFLGIDSDHSPFYSATDALVEALVDNASRPFQCPVAKHSRAAPDVAHQAIEVVGGARELTAMLGIFVASPPLSTVGLSANTFLMSSGDPRYTSVPSVITRTVNPSP